MVRGVRALLGLYPRNTSRVPHIPDFLSSFVGSLNFMRLSLMKGAHAELASSACRKFGASRQKRARYGGPGFVARKDSELDDRSITDAMSDGPHSRNPDSVVRSLHTAKGHVRRPTQPPVQSNQNKLSEWPGRFALRSIEHLLITRPPTSSPAPVNPACRHGDL